MDGWINHLSRRVFPDSALATTTLVASKFAHAAGGLTSIPSQTMRLFYSVQQLTENNPERYYRPTYFGHA